MQKNIKKMTDGELEKAINEVEDIIGVDGCFGKSDLVWRELLYTEVDRRGLEVDENYSFKIKLRKGGANK